MEGRYKRLTRVRRRKAGLLGIGTVAAVLCISLTAWALFQKNAAEIAHEQNQVMLHHASMGELSSAYRAFGEDEQRSADKVFPSDGSDSKWHLGIAHLVRAIRFDPENRDAIASLYLRIAIQAWEKWDAPSGIVLHHEGSITSCNFTTDGHRILTADSKGIASIWAADSGGLLATMRGHLAEIKRACFSNDGKYVLTCSGDATARVWESTTGEVKFVLSGHTKAIRYGEFSPDGTLAITASEDGTARLWEVASGRTLASMVYKDQVTKATFSPDGKSVAISSLDGTVGVHTVPDGRLLYPLQMFDGPVSDVEFSHDGTHLAGADGIRIVERGGYAQVWEANTGVVLGERLSHAKHVTEVDFSPDDTIAATSSEDGSVKFWDPLSGAQLGVPLAHGAPIIMTEFSSDGRYLAVCVAKSGTPARIQIWNVDRQEQVGEPIRHDGNVTTMSWSPDGKNLLVGSEDGIARIWPVNTRRSLSVTVCRSGDLGCANMGPTANQMLIGHGEDFELWDLSLGKVIRGFYGHSADIGSVAFSPDGTRLASASYDKTVKLWDVATGKVLATLTGHSERVNSVAFSPDGTRLASGSYDNSVKLWDVASGRVLANLIGHSDGVSSVAFSPDGTQVASGSIDNSVKLWDVATGKEQATLEGDANIITDVEFRRNRQQMAVASRDGKARVYNAASLKMEGELSNGYPVSSVSYSPNGDWIITSGDSGVRIWDANKFKSVAPLLSQDRDFSAGFNSDGTRIWFVNHDRACAFDSSFFDDAAKVVSIPEPVLKWCEAVCGLRFDEFGELELISQLEREKGVTLPSLTEGTWGNLVKWICLPLSDRTISPTSHITFRDIAERERDFGVLDGYESALDYDNDLPLARLGLAHFPSRSIHETNPVSITDLVDGSSKSSDKADEFLRAYEISRLDPADSDLQARAAKMLLEQNQLTLAQDAAKRALKVDPEDRLALRVLLDSNPEASVEEKLEGWKTLCRVPEVTAADFSDAGNFAASQSKWEEALSFLNRGSDRFPTNLDILRNLGWALIKMGEPVNAVDAFRKSDAMADGAEEDSSLLAGLTVSLWLSGDREAAVEEFYRLLDANPRYSDSMFLTELPWGDIEKNAIRGVLAEALRYATNREVIIGNIGNVNGDGSDEASPERMELLLKLLGLPDATAIEFAAAGYMAAQLSRSDESARVFAEGIDRFPQDVNLFQMKGWAYLLLGDYDSAIEAFRITEGLFKSSKPADWVYRDPIFWGLVIGHWVNGDKDSAVLEYRKLVITQNNGARSADYVKHLQLTRAESEALEAARIETLKRYPELAPNSLDEFHTVSPDVIPRVPEDRAK